MKIFLAAMEIRRGEMRGHAARLRLLGHEIVSKHDDPPSAGSSLAAIAEERDREPHGALSFSDAKDLQGIRTLLTRQQVALTVEGPATYAAILGCDLFVWFTDEKNGTREKAYCDYGIALGQPTKPVVIVGPRLLVEHHWYRDVPVFATFDEFLVELQAASGDAGQVGKRAGEDKGQAAGGL